MQRVRSADGQAATEDRFSPKFVRECVNFGFLDSSAVRARLRPCLMDARRLQGRGAVRRARLVVKYAENFEAARRCHECSLCESMTRPASACSIEGPQAGAWRRLAVPWQGHASCLLMHGDAEQLGHAPRCSSMAEAQPPAAALHMRATGRCQCAQDVASDAGRLEQW